ncbi:MAG: hypothetical protein K0U41_01635 [Gammaproteobacteria bacterium]|nr:hypothetical protein [Gammaproteobacteria bacterium]
MNNALLAQNRAGRPLSFDGLPCAGASLADLDTRLFTLDYLPNVETPDMVAKGQGNIRQQLASMGFYDIHSDQPTYSGILLFGKNPVHWIAGAYIQVVRFAGDSMDSEIMLEDALRGDLRSMLSKAELHLSVHNTHRPVRITTLKDKQVWQYPTSAVRELLMNAVMHRQYEGATASIKFYWYADHVEIQSSGGLYGEATPDNFPNQASCRNPLLAQAMKTLKYAKCLGDGVTRAQDALKANGNPRAEFTLDPSYVKASVKAVARGAPTSESSSPPPIL